MDSKHQTPATASQIEQAKAADAVSDDLAKLQTELTEQKDVYLRLAADFDNFKKRTRRESERLASAQKEAFINDLLPALDNLERALASEKSTSNDPLYLGVKMTLQQLYDLLRRHGIEAVDDVGRPFDPHRHEAISVRHDPGKPDQIILEAAQRGYCHGDKVFRPGKVIVNDLSRSPGVRHAG